MKIKLHNTLSGAKEDFEPIGDKVKMFVCGPTVYDLSHIGHAKTYIQMDVIARTLRQVGYELMYLQNITDIDDKIIARAKEQGVEWHELKSRFERSYLEDMQTLNVTSVDKYARATDYMDNIIKQVQALLGKGHAYTIDDDGIYFEITTFPEYGKLSKRRDTKSDDAQSRIDESDRKRGWNDFCLWKFSKADEPFWDAPFGSGRPGWHIEDTAISEHHFGPQYDIHGGAVDLIFPHHEAEITQMESVSGLQPFVRFWLHTGFLNLKDKKMAKSLGNFYTIREITDKGFEPMALRLLILQSHYRSSIDFSWELLETATNRLREIQAVADLRWQLKATTTASEGLDFTAFGRRLMDRMADDIDTPRALAELSAHLSAISDRLVSVNESPQFMDYLELLDSLFGLNLLQSEDINTEQKGLIKERENARDKGDYDSSDLLRKELNKQGLEVRDTSAGTIWQRKG